MSMTMNVPVRPIPALEHITGRRVTDRLKNRTGASGAPNFARALPAVHGDGPGIQDALLLQVDLLQEVQHAAGVGGDAVVGPGPEVVLPDGALRVALEPAAGQTYNEDSSTRTHPTCNLDFI